MVIENARDDAVELQSVLNIDALKQHTIFQKTLQIHSPEASGP